MARRRRYVRDNRGRFASTGATARGGRLKTASGKKRETQTMKTSGGGVAGTIGKPKGLKPGTIKPKPQVSSKPRRTRKPTAAESRAKGLTPISEIKARRDAQAKAAQAANQSSYQRRYQSQRTKVAADAYRKAGGKRQKFSTIKNPAPEGSAPFKVTGSTYQGRKNAAAGRAARDAKPKTSRRAKRTASPNLGRPAQVTARGRTIKPAENFQPAVKGKSAPDNARTRANKLKTAQNRVRMYSETSSRSAQNAIANRNAALKARPQGTPGKVIFRSKNRASSRFQQRANDLTTRIKGDLKYSKPGTFSATGGGGGKGITRRNTGDKQMSMFGKPAPLYTNKTAKSVKRRSGKRK
jgi:hypothetical protein